MPSKPLDTGDGDDQAIPIGTEFIINIEYFNGAMFLSAVANWVVGPASACRRLSRAQALHRSFKFGLIPLYLRDKIVFRISSNLKCFFDSALRRL